MLRFCPVVCFGFFFFGSDFHLFNKSLNEIKTVKKKVPRMQRKRKQIQNCHKAILNCHKDLGRSNNEAES